jgi:septum formation protein
MKRSAVKMPKLLLASASPRRREILRDAGIPFDVLATSISEVQSKGETARAFALRMAREKAAAALQLAGSSARQYVGIVAADTVVVVGRKTLGKPASHAEARRMLRLLSGREHRVLTGLCVLTPSRNRRGGPSWTRISAVASTTVKFSRLTSAEIHAYVSTGEPMDKAGAYGIQGRACKHIEWIRGCYFNVVGLPVSLLYRMLKRAER